jgi:hypothetical protein
MRFLFVSILFLAFCRVPAQKPVNVTIDAFDTAQRIDNFGASGAWYSEFIGRSWSLKTKEQLAEWLFREKTKAGGEETAISKGCLLIAPGDWKDFNKIMKGVTNFKVQITRTGFEKVPLQGHTGEDVPGLNNLVPRKYQ